MTVIPTLLTRELRPGGGVRASSSLGPPAPVWAADCPLPPPVFLFPTHCLLSLLSSPSVSTLPTPLQRLPCLQAGSCRSHTRKMVSADPGRGRVLVPHTPATPGCSWHLEGEGVGGRACMPLLLGGPGAGKSAQADGPPRSCGPPNLMLSSVAVTISGSHGVADSLISGKVCAQM